MDWSRIKTEFFELCTILEGVPAPPSKRELQTHRAKTKLGLPSALNDQLAQHSRAYFGSGNTWDRLDLLKTDIDSGGVQHSAAFGEKIQNCFGIIESSIATGACTTEFLLAWGYLNQLVGRFAELIEQGERDKKDFQRNEKAGASSDTVLQRYWHAHWVTQNSDTAREIAESELASVCADIWQGRLLAPKGYKADWFNTLITDDAGNPMPRRGQTDDAVLKTAYGRTKRAELEAMSKDKGVPVQMLPPLRRSDFLIP